MLSKLAHLTLCRSIHLLVLLARGDTAKDLELLVLHHQVAHPRLKPADRAPLAALSRALPRPLVTRLRQARDAAALAPPTRTPTARRAAAAG